MIVLGINAYHPDASIALLKDGVPVWAAEEERFNRVKHASGFPALALRACLEEMQIPPGAIDAVAISKNPRANLFRKMSYVIRQKPDREMVKDRIKAFFKSSSFEKDFFEALNVNPSFLRGRFFHVEHHEAHVASSFFMSGFRHSAFMTIDGMGDFSSSMWGIADGNRLNVFDRVLFPHSAGFLYTAATQFLGFTHFGDEYKVMGLAAYGEPHYVNEFRHMVKIKQHGQFELNLAYFTHQLGQAKIRWQGGAPEQDLIYSEKWQEKFGLPRPKDDPITDRDRNMAASLQAVLEEIYFHVLKHLYRQTKEKNLCLAGGVALNSVANGKIKSVTPFENIYIQPAAGDSGTALGAAAFVHYSVFGHQPKFVMKHASLGTEATDAEIEKSLIEKGVHFEKLPETEMLKAAVLVIEEGGVLGWFQGKMEFGPRALGNRSILADPRRKDMKAILNERIKRRESFRPFAPAVPVERAAEFFEMNCAETPFMLNVFPVKPDKRELLPAIVHVDGTARVQTVSKEASPLFWKLLNVFGEITGTPILLNTSFNENEPIVRTPGEAIDCFLKTRMDAIILGCYVVMKEKQVNIPSDKESAA